MPPKLGYPATGSRDATTQKSMVWLRVGPCRRSWDLPGDLLISQSVPFNPEDRDSIFLRRLDIRLQDHAMPQPRRAWFGCASGLAAEVGIYRATFGGQGLVEVVLVVSPVCAPIYSLRDPSRREAVYY
jgi:hypothetical protein